MSKEKIVNNFVHKKHTIIYYVPRLFDIRYVVVLKFIGPLLPAGGSIK